MASRLWRSRFCRYTTQSISFMIYFFRLEINHLPYLYQGGTPVHITSGFSALAYALAVGPRRTVVFEKHKPSNPSDIYLGTALLWFGIKFE